MKSKLTITAIVALIISVILITSGVVLELMTRPTSESNQVTETRNLAAFSRVQFDGIGDLEIRKGDKESLEIKASESQVKNVSTEVRDNTLYVSNEKKLQLISIGSNPKIKFILTAKDLDYINFRGTGSLVASDFKAERFEILTSGTSSTDINSIDANSVSISSTGNGDIKVNSIKAKNVDINSNGTGSSTFKNIESDKVSLVGRGTGDIELAGKTKDFQVNLLSTGNLRARGLISTNAGIQLSGTGNAEVSVKENLKVRKNNTGKFIYYGKPNISLEDNGNVGGFRNGGDIVE